MGVETYQDCPNGREIKIWIKGFDKCSEARKCLNKLCCYNKKEVLDAK